MKGAGFRTRFIHKLIFRQHHVPPFIGANETCADTELGNPGQWKIEVEVGHGNRRAYRAASSPPIARGFAAVLGDGNDIKSTVGHAGYIHPDGDEGLAFRVLTDAAD